MKNIFFLLVLAAAVAGLAACTTSEFQAPEIVAATRAADPGRPTSATFTPIEQQRAEPPIQLDYGKGGCETKYANGTTGTCINGRPCNGFGFKDERGETVCACYAARGGCEEGFACSVRKRTCVPRGEVDWLRTPSK